MHEYSHVIVELILTQWNKIIQTYFISLGKGVACLLKRAGEAELKWLSPLNLVIAL